MVTISSIDVNGRQTTKLAFRTPGCDEDILLVDVKETDTIDDLDKIESALSEKFEFICTLEKDLNKLVCARDLRRQEHEDKTPG